jgi:hypothetical protein
MRKLAAEGVGEEEAAALVEHAPDVAYPVIGYTNVAGAVGERAVELGAAEFYAAAAEVVKRVVRCGAVAAAGAELQGGEAGVLHRAAFDVAIARPAEGERGGHVDGGLGRAAERDLADVVLVVGRELGGGLIPVGVAEGEALETQAGDRPRAERIGNGAAAVAVVGVTGGVDEGVDQGRDDARGSKRLVGHGQVGEATGEAV